MTALQPIPETFEHAAGGDEPSEASRRDTSGEGLSQEAALYILQPLCFKNSLAAAKNILRAGLLTAANAASAAIRC